MGVHWYVTQLKQDEENVRKLTGLDNYDISELWYEYEVKKKAAREEAQARGEPITIEG